MTKRRKKHSKSKKSRKVGPVMGFLGMLVAALLGVAGLAGQQGLIKVDTPSIAAALNTEGDRQPTDDQGQAAAAVAPAASKAALGLGSVPGAANDNCAIQFLGGVAPELTNEALAAKTTQLCYQGFAVLNSGITRTPLWTAEHLTPARIAHARGLPREGSFHADKNLAEDHRAELEDYKGFGFDRGHMAPNGDMPDEQSQAECFTLANMAPQVADTNRGIWRQIESEVRDLAETSADVYVVTGPIYEGEEIETLNGRVMVPTAFYKAVYDAKKGQGAAYVVKNADNNDDYETISLTELKRRIGIDVFPALPEETTGELVLPALSGKRHS